jgi:hypothetical protein
VLPLSFSITRWNFTLLRQYLTIKNCYLKRVVFVICASAFWQCLQSSHQAVCCHLGPHEEEVGEESNTDSQPAEDEDDPIARCKKRSGHLSKPSVATLNLVKKNLKKNPTLTASRVKMRMRMEQATTSPYTDMSNKLLF